MKKVLFIVALIAFTATATFAQNAPATAKTEAVAKPKKAKKGKKGKEASVEMFQCPMKCEPARDYAGKCPKCLMELVSTTPPKKKATDGHSGHSH